jgi:hypothetical protein
VAERTLRENLERVRLLLAGSPDSTDPVRWMPRVRAHDAERRPTSYFDKGARFWNLHGAIYRAVDWPGTERHEVIEALRAHLPEDNKSLDSFENKPGNNVIELIDKALAACDE